MAGSSYNSLATATAVDEDLKHASVTHMNYTVVVGHWVKKASTLFKTLAKQRRVCSVFQGRLFSITMLSKLILFREIFCGFIGDRGSTVVKVLCYKSEGSWFNSR